MSAERREFNQWRRDTYAAELSKCPPAVTIDPDVDDAPNGVCVCCGKWRFIPKGSNDCGCWRGEE